MDNQKTIGNVNFLNLTNATEASVAGIRRIGNINLAVYYPETFSLLNRLNPGNVNAAIEVPSGSNLVIKTGQVQVNADFFKNAVKAVFFLVTGQLVVEPGVPVEEIEKGLAGIAVNGQFFCPEDLVGAFNAKPNTVVGQSVAYPPLEHFVNGKLTLDAAWLNGLNDGAEICVLGDVRAPKVLPNDLLERKIGKLYVSGGIQCHEENARAIRARLYKSKGEFKTIPAGHEWIEKPLVLDSETLEILPGKSLYCSELVQIADEVTPAALDAQIERLVGEDLLISPAALKPVLARKCNLFETRAIFYSDQLLLVQDERTWQESRFASLKGTATLVVRGELTFDPAVSPATLSERFSKVHNFGLIRCTPEQLLAIETRLATREGEIEEMLPGKESEPEEAPREDHIGNVNYLVL